MLQSLQLFHTHLDHRRVSAKKVHRLAVVALVAVTLLVIQVIHPDHHRQVSAKRVHRLAVVVLVAVMLVLLPIQQSDREVIFRHVFLTIMILHLEVHRIWDII